MATPKSERVGRSGEDPDVFQRRMLPRVSRTFALTIPQLPDELGHVVANAYLLCRIADTIEDDPELSSATKARLHAAFVAALESDAQAGEACSRMADSLSERTPDAERELLRGTALVIEVTRSFRRVQRDALVTCVRTMCDGMGEYQRNASLSGLADTEALDRYCYYVAGVVGEMLTALFIDHCPAVAAQRTRMMALAPSFGEGLQLTNILKDLWDDRRRGACWMPRDRFSARGIDVRALEDARGTPEFEIVLGELVGLAHGHLRNALEYTLMIPRSEAGVRRFCLWAIGMAMLTLRRIRGQPGYRSGAEVKIPRYWVRSVVIAANAAAGSDRGLRWLFRGLAAGLPLEGVEAGGAVASPRPIDDEPRQAP